MPSTPASPIGHHFSCRCLNVRIRTAAPHTPPPEGDRDPLYTPVYVEDEGIVIAHLQVTVRTRLKAVAIPGTTRHSRFASLTCLLCDLPAYRVLQVAPIDVDGKEGPLLPTEDWVENEVMKSSTGWIEVHRDCLTGDAIAQTEHSSNYSHTFSLMLPPLPSPPKPSDPSTASGSLSSPPNASPPLSPPSYLSSMRPLFPPPPFTPTHPAFLHFASLAGNESQALRSAAEQYIADIVRDKIAEVERAEGDLRRQVEALWRKFRESVNSHQERYNTIPTTPRSPMSRREGETWSGSIGSPSYGTPVAIRDFIPAAVPISRSPPPSTPRMSGLSASLATSSFHHPRAKGPSPSEPEGSPDSVTSQTLSSHSGSSTLVQPPAHEGSTVLRFPRNINDAINTTASYRYFVNLEEDMARHKREQEAARGQPQGYENDQNREAGPSQLPTSPNTNGNKKQKKSPLRSLPMEDNTGKAEGELETSRGRESTSKGKRRVTFDVQPAVVTIKQNAAAEKEDVPNGEDPREMIFDLEDLDGEGEEQTSSTQKTLPLIDQPPVSRPARSARVRVQNPSGLPESLASLRPASLPAPSHIRPLRSQPGVDASSQNIILSLPRAAAPISLEAPRTSRESNPTSPVEDKPLDPRDAEIMKLVAANTPSHRGAWNTSGTAWKTFTRRQDLKDHPTQSNIPEETEDENNLGVGTSEMGQRLGGSPAGNVDYAKEEENEDDDANNNSYLTAGIAGSLPINISIRNAPREVLSLASYQPKTLLSEHTGPSESPAPKGASSTAIRKAAYAERDRSRSMDPGALDFAAEADPTDEDNSDSDLSKPDAAVESAGERGRKRALRILEKRSEVPDAGMWRSLAS